MRWLLMVIVFCLFPATHAQVTPESMSTTKILESLPIQHQGRVMPWSTYADRIAVQLTGRTNWSESRGPASFAGISSMQLFGQLMFRPESLATQPLIRIDRRPLKKQIGLDVEQRFFSPEELLGNEELMTIAENFRAKRKLDNTARPSTDEKAALEAQESVSLFLMFATDTPIRIVPNGDNPTFLQMSSSSGDNGTEHAQIALNELRDAWGSPNAPAAAQDFATAIESTPGFSATLSNRLDREVLYNHHAPWKMAAVACAMSILALGLGWLTRWKLAFVLAGLFIVWAVGEQLLGLGLRISILGRAPVSNTYEALLWMGLVAIAVGLVAQAINRRSCYLAGGMAASLIAILFAMLVPLEDQTNTLPAVLRSNYWLILHVLTIVASYGALLLAAVLGHIYLIRNVILRKQDQTPGSRVIVQVYRVIQVGLILLTAGTILGGVWAADSWGRFWGWDPKETWSLISIIIYFALIHARYVGWIRDFGLAVSAILGFLAIVWTFYGVNYVLASGLHSYGFGSGGEMYIIAWAAAEIVFVGACTLRIRSEKTAKAIIDTQSNRLDTRERPETC